MSESTPVNLPKFSPSSFQTYNQCPTLWKFTYIDGLRQKGTKQYFEVGTYAHELMHHMYRAVKEGIAIGSDMLYALMEARMRQDAEKLTDDNAILMATVQKLFRDYIYRQSPKIDNIIHSVIGVEHVVTIQVTTPHGHEVILEGIADLVYSTVDGRIRVRDHKTGQRDVYSDENLPINPQLLFYFVVLSMLEHPMAGVEISFINSYPYKDRSQKKFWELFKFYGPFIPSTEVIQQFWNYLLKRVDTILETVPEPSYGQQCGSCAFKQVCIMNLNGVDPTYYILGQYDKTERSYKIPVRWGEADSSGSAETSIEHSNGDSIIEVDSSNLFRWQ